MHSTENSIQSSSEKVIIIGAGAAGLSAARYLSNAGKEVVVLEARERVGGRTWTSRMDKDIAVDCGGSWIEGLEGNPLTEIAQRHNSHTTSDEGEVVLYDEDGSIVQSSENDKVVSIFNIILKHFQEAAQEQDDECNVQEKVLNSVVLQGLEDKRSLYERLNMILRSEQVCRDLTDRQKRILDWHLSGFEEYFAALVSELSLKNYDQGPEFPGGSAFVADGYGDLVLQETEPETLDVRLNTVVDKIEYGSEMVRVTTQDGQELTGNYCICTLPLGCLKANTVQFCPPLPQNKQNAIEKLGFGLMNKVILRFKEAFWPPNAGALGYASSNRGEARFFLNLYPMVGSPILMLFTTCTYAEEMEALDDNDVVERSMQVLQAMFPNQSPQWPEEHIVTRWNKDPYSRGSYLYMAPGSSFQDVLTLAEPVDRLLFAGEAAAEHYCSVHGAYMSGQREAERILKESKQRQQEQVNNQCIEN
eukprot:gb/GECH01000442.1/.p1 GENE.gb/GECH01000442.1/~~gb/GECH01000442.1/.p1  ORF type:complete len:475 (+),score=127.02 gb/GECH01000442.1/:1-1425(+)